MADNKEKTVSSPETTVVKGRRGVSNKTQAVSQLRFHEKDASPNGLFVGHLESVSVDWSVNADGKQFTGLKVPRLTFHFASNHKNATEQRHVYQTLFPVESNVETCEGGDKAWQVDNVLNWIKHFLDIFYLKGRDMTTEEEDALMLNFVDVDAEGHYSPVDAEKDVLPAYRTLFENAAAMMNGSFGLADGEVAKPCYKNADGTFVTCWIKLLRHIKNRKGEWTSVQTNGDLSFPGFPGNGVVELMKKDTPPLVLRIDVSKESITPKEIKKAPTIGTPGVPGGMPMGGAVVGGGMPMGNMGSEAYADAGGEMPF